MLIVCPDCETSYQVEAASLGDTGRSVRCARCHTVWFAEAPRTLVAIDNVSGDDSPPAYEEPPVRHDEWWAGNGAPPEPEPSSGADEWGIAAGEVPSEISGPQQDVPASDRIVIRITTESPPLVPISSPTPDDVPHDDHHEATIDVETVAARGAKLAVAPRPARKPRKPGLALAAMILITAIAGLVAGRAQIVRYAPQTAALYKAVGLAVNLRGLEFTDVRISGENEDDVPVLVVEGKIVNSVNRPVEVPRMRFALLNPAGMETYAWTAPPTRTVLGEGETLAFRSRLASPPADIRDVQVRFLNRRDREAGR